MFARCRAGAPEPGGRRRFHPLSRLRRQLSHRESQALGFLYAHEGDVCAFLKRPAYRLAAIAAAVASPLALPLGELSPQVTEREYRLRLFFPMLRRFRHNAAAAGERSSPLRDVWPPWRRIPPGTVPPPHPREAQTPLLRHFFRFSQTSAGLRRGRACPARRASATHPVIFVGANCVRPMPRRCAGTGWTPEVSPSQSASPTALP